MKFTFTLLLGFAGVLGIVFLFAWLSEKVGLNTPRPHQPTQEEIYWLNEQYMAVAEAMVECLSHRYYDLGLCRPDPAPIHMKPFNEGVEIRPGRQIWYTLVFSRRNTASPLSGKIVYSTTSPLALQRAVNQFFPNFCVAQGVGPHTVVSVKDLPGGLVAFTIQ